MKMKQTGFTLIELMIGLLLSTALIAGIGKVFIDSGNSFRKQKTLSYLVEDGRYSQEVLAKEFRRLGFLRNRHAAGNQPADIFKADNNVLGSGLNLTSEGYVFGGFNNTGFSGDAFDINHIVFRYQLNDKNDLSANNPNYSLSPCTKDIHLTAGEDPAQKKIIVTLYFYVAFDTTLATPVLYCKAKRVNLDDSSKNKVSSAIPLISHVEKLFILYGIDTDADTDNFANRYLRADQVSASDWKNNVVSVRLYLVLGSEEPHVILNTPGYNIDDRPYVVTSPADKRLYKVFTSTISFRNDWL